MQIVNPCRQFCGRQTRSNVQLVKHRAGNNCPVSWRFITTERGGDDASATLIFGSMLTGGKRPIAGHILTLIPTGWATDRDLICRRSGRIDGVFRAAQANRTMPGPGFVPIDFTLPEGPEGG